jgi:Na+/H+-translocating membrane pyrophosphatase
VRGGAIPIFLWGTLLLVLMIINVIWARSGIQAATFAYAIFAVYGTALALFVVRRESVRKGPPIQESSPQAIPRSSLAAMTLGIAIGAMMFGVVFGKFLVFIGGGIWLLAAGRLVVEVRAQRRSLRGREDDQ